ncbi:Pleiotropic drug resistance protein tur2, partial [Asimina triloba]
MDCTDLYRVGSLQRDNPSIWANAEIENVFSQSSRQDDDEESLKWAALEKLPTYDRIRRGILSGVAGEGVKEVDIHTLGLQERKAVLEKLVRVAETDNEAFLWKFKNRIDRVGIEMPTIEARYENLNVSAETYIGSRGLPTVLNFIFNMVEGLLNTLHILPSQKRPISILHNISGIIRPRRMTLLLGPPGSGKTTLLLALAGRLDRELKASGRVTYNGHGMEEFVPQRTSAYISQHDLHIGEMTVRETLAFSARCQGVGSRYEMLAELSRREKAANIKPDPDLDVFMKVAALEGQKESIVTDYILKILGLEVCADTMVGDQMLRGISGGQKKRVTTGEMLVGPAKALFMDEISTGLDSSTTFQIVNSLRQSIRILGGTALIALLQPAPETYDLFDDIILLSDGEVVYQGPREHVLEFFETMGFKCPERKGVADFLQEVTSRKDQQQYWAHKNEPYRYIPVKEFADAFRSFHESLLVVALIAMTVFFPTKMHRDSVNDGSIFMGALFFALVTLMFNGFSELAMTVAKLPVFYKQRDLCFYPPWAYSLPTWIVKIPVSCAEVAIYVGLTYYVIGFDPNVGRMFKQYLVFLFISQMASGLFRLVASLGRNMIVANTFGAFSFFAILTLGGFVVSRKDLKKWWIWGYWSSPLMYAQNAVATNEFLGHSWKHFAPNSTELLGIQILESRAIFAEAKWYWLGVVALIGYVLLFNGLYTAALTYLD